MSFLVRHKNLGPADGHPSHSLVYVDQTARLAAGYFTAADAGRVAHQLSDDTFWMLTEVSPVRWVSVTKGFGPGGWQSMVDIFDKAVVVPATPNAVLIDEEINLWQYGLVSTTAVNVNFGVIIEKPDGKGGWVASNNPDYLPNAPGVPAADPPGYEVAYAGMARPMQRPLFRGGDPWPSTVSFPPFVIERGQYPGQDIDIFDNNNWQVTGSPTVEDRQPKLRVLVARTDRVYSPLEQATNDALGYRVRVIVRAINMVVWEKTVNIPTADGAIVLSDEVDLTDFGAVSDTTRLMLSATWKRGGKIIRSFEYPFTNLGERLDVPAPPVTIRTVNRFNESPWWNDQNQSGGVWPQKDANVRFSPAIANCSSDVVDKLYLRVWRNGAAPTTYWDGTYYDMEYRTPDVVLKAWSTGETQPSLQLVEAAILSVPGKAQVADEQKDAPFAGALLVYFRPGATWQDIANVLAAMPPNAFRPRVDTLINPAALAAIGQYQLAPIAPMNPVPVPAGSEQGCTLTLRILVSPPDRIGDWPFDDEIPQSGDVGVGQLLLRPARGSKTFPFKGLWMDLAFKKLRWRDQQVVVSPDGTLVVQSPGGNFFRIVVSDAGVLSATLL